jgi:hypothetical protein
MRGGLEVSASSLLQNELIQRQIGKPLTQPAVLDLKVPQALHLRFNAWRHQITLAHVRRPGLFFWLAAPIRCVRRRARTGSGEKEKGRPD